jgi:hypothetical protein
LSRLVRVRRQMMTNDTPTRGGKVFEGLKRITLVLALIGAVLFVGFGVAGVFADSGPEPGVRTIVGVYVVLVVVILFVPLALTERSSLFLRSLLVLVAALVAFWCTLLSGLPHDHVIEEAAGGGVVTVETATPSASRVVGMWLVLLGAGELLRLTLKREAGTRLLAPAAVFLGGVLLLEPHWGISLAFGAVALAIALVAIWGRRATGQ